MKVLFLTHSFPRHRRRRRLVRAPARDGAARRGHRHARRRAGARRALRSTRPLDDMPVERFRYAPRRYETLAYTGNMASQVQASWSARVALLGFLGAEFRSAVRARREFEPDVVHAHWWFPNGLVGTWLGRMAQQAARHDAARHRRAARAHRRVLAARVPSRACTTRPR